MCLPSGVCWGECSPVHDCLVVCVHPMFRACLLIYVCLPVYLCLCVCVLCVYVCVWCLPLCGHLLCVYVMTVSPCVRRLSLCLCLPVYQVLCMCAGVSAHVCMSHAHDPAT